MNNKRAQRIAKFGRPRGAFSFIYFRFSFEANQDLFDANRLQPYYTNLCTLVNVVLSFS